MRSSPEPPELAGFYVDSHCDKRAAQNGATKALRRERERRRHRSRVRRLGGLFQGGPESPGRAGPRAGGACGRGDPRTETVVPVVAAARSSWRGCRCATSVRRCARRRRGALPPSRSSSFWHKAATSNALILRGARSCGAPGSVSSSLDRGRGSRLIEDWQKRLGSTRRGPQD